jgi:hypothetical protein
MCLPATLIGGPAGRVYAIGGNERNDLLDYWLYGSVSAHRRSSP